MISLTKNAVYVIGRMLGDKKGYGLRLKKKGGCCSVLFDLHLDKKEKGDKTIKNQGKLQIFADKETLDSMKALSEKNIFMPAKIDYIKTHLGPSFFTDNHRIGINIWEHEIE